MDLDRTGEILEEITVLTFSTAFGGVARVSRDTLLFFWVAGSFFFLSLVTPEEGGAVFGPTPDVAEEEDADRSGSEELSLVRDDDPFEFEEDVMDASKLFVAGGSAPIWEQV